MHNRTFAVLCLSLALFASCSKTNGSIPGIRPYLAPGSYNFSNASVVRSTQGVKMIVEVDRYLKQANAGTGNVPLDAAKLANYYANMGNPFADASLNSSGISLKDIAADAATYEAFADSVVLYNTGAAAFAGKGGIVTNGTNKIIVGSTGLEFSEAFLKGMMGGLCYKEAVRLLTEVKAGRAADSSTAQKKWDEAFGYLGVPVNYDTAVVYTGTSPDRPLLWGTYLANAGKPISAARIIYSSFINGRAAIGAFDATTRDENADNILEKWEQLIALLALNALNTSVAAATGDAYTRLHALSEAYGYITILKYRPANSPLSANGYAILTKPVNADFYNLGTAADMKNISNAQALLKSAYQLN